MSATATQIAELRRMTGEPTTDPYTDEILADYIERYPCLDELGQEPYTWDTSTEPPSQVENDFWIPTYDIDAAAADVWQEKASTVAACFDFSADGGRYSRSQVYAQYMQQARFYRSRRKPQTMHSFKWPPEDNTDRRPPWVFNLPEVD